ncbi:tetratricopeptide repeat protein [Celerinatantimonas diazotrophica]|uniref:Tight adherence protein D n=1 Tax=Celerinatantimonas diazotrophica TaxID=412034 RepID=A0A4R1KGW5_9GAMM|nr:tetratricopeptide repeat protein [Celerinatantimonas diazotrophica]TCK64005.1 tight adherence protein D [Celerinatantimonas diazotrophica]CAG9297096.1 Beta-barrel assembly-enhancing protease [Celerinatantimonas diazotrophica]
MAFTTRKSSIIASLLVVGLTGCSMQGNNYGLMQNRVSDSSAQVADQPLTASQKVQLMIKAQNYPGLIKFYKQTLEHSDSRSVRLKLAKTYYQSGDVDSALFQLKILKQHYKPDAQVHYLMAQCLYQKGKMTDALTEVNTAITLNPKQAKSYNLQGIIDAGLNDFVSARKAFNKARALMYKDSIVLNNLAMIDIYQHKYSDAVNLLLPLYNNGQADKKIRSNLLIALAKTHQESLFKQVYADGDSDQANMVYHQLENSKHGIHARSTP